MCTMDGHDHSSREIDIPWLAVQHAQLGVGLLDVVHILHSPVHTVQDNLSVVCNHRVSDDGSGVVEVSKSAEIPLSPGVDNQAPERTSHTHKLIQKASDQ
uniref:Uncharacterized protein n=1 Tax=Seriola dumerili TaxID=41447 RepID=A0A3B4VCF4_SERDU